MKKLMLYIISLLLIILGIDNFNIIYAKSTQANKFINARWTSSKVTYEFFKDGYYAKISDGVCSENGKYKIGDCVLGNGGHITIKFNNDEEHYFIIQDNNTLDEVQEGEQYVLKRNVLTAEKNPIKHFTISKNNYNLNYNVYIPKIVPPYYAVNDLKKADINGDGTLDNLIGLRSINHDTKLLIQDGKSLKILKCYNLGVWYGPTISIGDFNGDRVKDVMFMGDCGGSSGYNCCYIFTGVKNNFKTLFSSEDKKFSYVSKMVSIKENPEKKIISAYGKGFKKIYTACPKAKVSFYYTNGPRWQTLDYDKDGKTEVVISSSIERAVELNEIIKFNKSKYSWELKDFYLKPNEKMKVVKHFK